LSSSADTLSRADFVRNGNANQIMKMSKEHTTQLWNAVIDNDYTSFQPIHSRLLNAPTALKHVPLRIYIPSAPPPSTSQSAEAAASASSSAAAGRESGSFRVLQSLVPAMTRDRKTKLLGQALRDMLPTLFPSSRDPILASVVMHGAAVPFDAPLGDLMKEAAYPDGWLCLVVTVL
jgi:autophagy-related protein 5